MLAPSNTSGHQKWNGTAEILKPMPTISPKIATASSADPADADASAVAIAGAMLVELERAVQAVEQRQAVDHDRAGGRAEQDVLQRRLGADAVGLAEARPARSSAATPSRRP